MINAAMEARAGWDYARATELYEECLALVHELGDREGIGIALLGLGDIARDQGEAGRVRAYCEQTLALFQELGQTWAIAFSLNNLALAAYLDADLALAAQRAEESVALFRDLQAGPSLAEVLVALGRVRGAQGAAVAAQTHLSEALTLAGVAGPRFVVAAELWTSSACRRCSRDTYRMGSSSWLRRQPYVRRWARRYSRPTGLLSKTR
jgi:hypothetical protein